MKLQYVANDGQMFDNEQECLEYEAKYSYFMSIWNGYKDPNKNNKWISGIVDKGDVINGKFVLDSLSKYFDISPKKPNGPFLNHGNDNEQAWNHPVTSTKLLHENTPITG